jgi:hypothetical protein
MMRAEEKPALTRFMFLFMVSYCFLINQIVKFRSRFCYIKNCFALIVPEDNVEQALQIMRNHPLGKQANRIGTVKQTAEQGMLTLKTSQKHQRNHFEYCF